MAKPLPEIQHDTIVAAVGKRPKGATLVQVAASPNPPPPLRNVQRWLNALVRKGRLVFEGSTKGARYQLPSRVGKEPARNASTDGAAIQQLMNQPIELRAAADYRRVFLDSCSLNRTSYVPADLRAHLAAPLCRGNGAGLAQSWREPAMLKKIVIDLAWLSGCLESGILNASMACLVVNVPLLGVGLPPITFAGVRGADLLDGLHGVRELNRTEHAPRCVRRRVRRLPRGWPHRLAAGRVRARVGLLVRD